MPRADETGGTSEVIKNGPGQPTGAMDHGKRTVCPSYMIM